MWYSFTWPRSSMGDDSILAIASSATSCAGRGGGPTSPTSSSPFRRLRRCSPYAAASVTSANKSHRLTVTTPSGIPSGPRMSRMSPPSSAPTETTSIPKRSVESVSLASPGPTTWTSKLGISNSPNSNAAIVRVTLERARPPTFAGAAVCAPSNSNGARSSESGQTTLAPTACSTVTVIWIRPPTVTRVVSTSLLMRAS